MPGPGLGSDIETFHGRVLIIEDNLDIATLLVDFFSDRGHVVDCANDGLTGTHLVGVNNYDAIILDLALPGIDGIGLCKQLRTVMNSTTPVLILTARDSLDDKLMGFDAGADDYLVKPFELLEVYARVQALWRRSLLSNRAFISVSELSLDLKTLMVKREGNIIKLNPVRLKILRLLMENSHKVVSKREIESYVWGDEPTESDALRTHLSAIRQVIDKPFDKKLLHTIHGIGYRLYDEQSH
ncbi:MAG: response regulator transcription factor [Pseudomonadales bacterium]|nr:response regulator transcription factor [Pseudomonadales bacterium]